MKFNYNRLIVLGTILILLFCLSSCVSHEELGCAVFPRISIYTHQWMDPIKIKFPYSFSDYKYDYNNTYDIEPTEDGFMITIYFKKENNYYE